MQDKHPTSPAAAGKSPHEATSHAIQPKKPGFDPKSLKGQKGGKPAHQTVRHTQAPIKPRGR